MKRFRNARSLGYLSCGYFLLLASVNFILAAAASDATAWDVMVLVLCALPFIFRGPAASYAVGWTSLLLWSYLWLALSSDLIHYRQGAQYINPFVYFAGGYVFVTTCIVFSILVIYASGRRPLNTKVIG